MPKLTIFAFERWPTSTSRAVDAEDLGGGRRVDVLAGAEDPLQHSLVGDVGEDPQLDLAVVGGDAAVARLGDEAAAERAADLGADRDVLQVRVGAREAPGRARGLVEGGVDPAGRRGRSASGSESR